MTKQPAGRGTIELGSYSAPPYFIAEVPMIGFHCVPMDTASATRFRQTDRDDAHNPLHRRIADHPSPCRHCLAEAEVGEPVLLGSYHFGRPHGVYWTPSPIFVHAEPCERFEQSDTVPEIVRHRL